MRNLRGGSWLSDPKDPRSAYRNRYSSDRIGRFYNIGFRVAMTLTS
jgi:formylglycine-generating enzyme required for sulfatase activity